MPHTTTLAAVLTHTTGIMLMPGGGPDRGWTDLQDYIVGFPIDQNAPTNHHVSSDRARTDLTIDLDLIAQFPVLADAVPPHGHVTSAETAAAWVEAVSERTGIPLTVEVLSRAEVERSAS